MKALAISAVLLSGLVVWSPSPTDTAAHTYQGTVQAVHSQTASFDLIVGVGFALRVVPMRTSPATQFADGGTKITLSDLQPGDIVWADCRLTATGLVAERVEKLEAADSKLEPTE